MWNCFNTRQFQFLSQGCPSLKVQIQGETYLAAQGLFLALGSTLQPRFLFRAHYNPL